MAKVLATPDNHRAAVGRQQGGVHRAAAGQDRAEPARPFSSPLALSGLLCVQVGRCCTAAPSPLTAVVPPFAFLPHGQAAGQPICPRVVGWAAQGGQPQAPIDALVLLFCTRAGRFKWPLAAFLRQGRGWTRWTSRLPLPSLFQLAGQGRSPLRSPPSPSYPWAAPLRATSSFSCHGVAAHWLHAPRLLIQLQTQQGKGSACPPPLMLLMLWPCWPSGNGQPCPLATSLPAPFMGLQPCPLVLCPGNSASAWAVCIVATHSHRPSYLGLNRAVRAQCVSSIGPMARERGSSFSRPYHG
ncbi:hypothetical protein L7F22_035595 [Adiantum nelumboides]|nr:hypothetical protein [Adiantum nelumboides]